MAGEAAEEAGKYIEGAQPYAFSTLEQFLATDPLILAGGAGALLLVYFLAPPLFSSIAYAARGYQGKLEYFTNTVLMQKCTLFSLKILF